MKRVAGVVLFCGIALVGQADQANERNFRDRLIVHQ